MFSDPHGLLSISTPRSAVLHGELTVPQPVKKFPAFYRIERFITVFITAAICPYPYSFRPVSPKYILTMPPSTPSFSKCSSLMFSPTQNTYAVPLSPIRALYPANLILLYLITQITIGEQYKPWSAPFSTTSHCFFFFLLLRVPSSTPT